MVFKTEVRQMIFNELYSAYYNTVSKIIKEIIDGSADNESIHKIIQENAFHESIINILPAIREEKWQIITRKYKTPIKNIPSMPLTNLQKSWLKSCIYKNFVLSLYQQIKTTTLWQQTTQSS